MNLNKYDIYSYKSYKKFVSDFVKSHPQNGRGMFSKIAKHLSSQSSFVSQVFSGDLDLTQDQAFKLSSFLKLDENATNYFLLLVDFSRAGVALRQHLEKEIKKKQDLAFKARIKGTNSLVLSDVDQQVYYSTWHYSVIHVALSINHFQNINKLAVALGLELSVVEKIIHYLVSKDLIRIKSNGTYEPGVSKLHLDWDSKNLIKHHCNFRLLAINSIDKGPDLENIHYSSAISLSKEDVQRLHDQLSEQIKKVKRAEKSIFNSLIIILFIFSISSLQKRIIFLN